MRETIDPASSLTLRIKYRQVDEGWFKCALQLVARRLYINRHSAEIRSSVTDVFRSLSPSSRASIERAVREILADRSKWRSYLIGESLEELFRYELKDMGDSGLAFCEVSVTQVPKKAILTRLESLSSRRPCQNGEALRSPLMSLNVAYVYLV